MSNLKHRKKPYIPDSDVGKLYWMEKFLACLELNPERFGFDDPREFEYVQRTIRTFITLARSVNMPGRRCRSLVTQKNKARTEAVELCRKIAMRLKWDDSITDVEKRAMGLCVEADEPQPAALPGGVLTGSLGHPSLNVINSYNGGHIIHYSDSTSPSRAKPKGVSHFLLFAAIGDVISEQSTAKLTPVSQARLLGAYTKRPFEVLYPNGCGLEGRRVTYWGRWLTTRGEMSPWSMPCMRVIGDALGSWEQCEFTHIFADVEGRRCVEALPMPVKELPAAAKSYVKAPVKELPSAALAEDRAALDGLDGERERVSIVDERPLLMSEALEARMAALVEEGRRILEGAAARMLQAG